MEDEFLTRVELSARLKIPVGTLNKWASEGSGPPYVRPGRGAIYRWSDVEAWLSKVGTTQREAVGHG